MAQTPLFIMLLMTAAVGFSQSHAAGLAVSPSTGTALPGNPAAGKTIFNGSGGCLSCHRVGATGSVLGPNLSNIGSRVSPDALRQSLMAPPTEVEPQNRLYEVVTRDGKTIRGKLLNQDPFSLQMLDASGQLVALARSDLRDAHFVDPPAMPSYRGKLTGAQMDDLVAYLASLRTPGDR
jgi:putative heme-binding domain-containing protein